MSILHFSNFCLEARNGEEGVVLQCDILTAYLLQLLPNFGFNWNRFSLPPCNTIKQNPRQLCMDSLSHIAHKSAMGNTQASLSLTLPFLGTGMKTDLFQSCGHCWVFQICWHIECSTFTALSFRIWNSSTGILSHPLALFVVIVSKTHLTSHSRMSDSRWVNTPLWLSGSWGLGTGK